MLYNNLVVAFRGTAVALHNPNTGALHIA